MGSIEAMISVCRNGACWDSIQLGSKLDDRARRTVVAAVETSLYIVCVETCYLAIEVCVPRLSSDCLVTVRLCRDASVGSRRFLHHPFVQPSGLPLQRLSLRLRVTGAGTGLLLFLYLERKTFDDYLAASFSTGLAFAESDGKTATDVPRHYGNAMTARSCKCLVLGCQTNHAMLGS